MNLLARLLHTLGDIADSKDCDRPSEALNLLLSQSQNYNPDELQQVHQELDTMKAVIGDLSLRIDSMNKETKIIPMKNETKRKNLHQR